MDFGQKEPALDPGNHLKTRRLPKPIKDHLLKLTDLLFTITKIEQAIAVLTTAEKRAGYEEKCRDQ